MYQKKKHGLKHSEKYYKNFKNDELNQLLIVTEIW